MVRSFYGSIGEESILVAESRRKGPKYLPSRNIDIPIRTKTKVAYGDEGPKSAHFFGADVSSPIQGACIAPDSDPSFSARKEDLVLYYLRPLDPSRP